MTRFWEYAALQPHALYLWHLLNIELVPSSREATTVRTKTFPGNSTILLSQGKQKRGQWKGKRAFVDLRTCILQTIWGYNVDPSSVAWKSLLIRLGLGKNERNRQLQRGQRKTDLQIKTISQKYENKYKPGSKYFKRKVMQMERKVNGKVKSVILVK